VIFVGLPAAGKTTFYQQRFSASHRHISKDLWRHAHRKDERQARELRAALAAGIPVVVDNTNPTAVDRQAIIAIARELGARVVGYYFDATTRDAIGRNRGREGTARVPDVAIFTAAKRMTPPVRDEGFDELHRVSVVPDGGFAVDPM
jgi:predicted kinase